MDPRNPCDSTQGFSPSRTRGNWLHEYDKMKLSVLEHQTWWERSSKRKKRSKQKRHDKTKLSVLEHQTWWERSSKERNARNKKRHHKTKLSILEHQTWWKKSSKKGRRYPEERKIKRLNHDGQTASTYGSLLRPERN